MIKKAEERLDLTDGWQYDIDIDIDTGERAAGFDCNSDSDSERGETVKDRSVKE